MMSKFILICTILLLLSISQSAFAVPATPYPDINIYYEANHQIWLFNPKTKERKYIDDGITPLMSHKKDKLVYAKYSDYSNSSDITITLYIYFVSTHKIEKLLAAKEGEFYEYLLGIEEWSPDDKYIILDTGGSEDRGKIVIDSITGNKITDFGILQSRYAWLSENEIVFTETQSLNGHYRDYAGSPLGISILNLQTLEKKVLRPVNQTEDFSFQKLSKNNEIFFIKTRYKTNEQGYIDADRYYYMTMDKNGENEKELSNSKKYINPQYTATWPHLSKNMVVVTIERRFYIMDEVSGNILMEIENANSVTW